MFLTNSLNYDQEFDFFSKLSIVHTFQLIDALSIHQFWFVWGFMNKVIIIQQAIQITMSESLKGKRYDDNQIDFIIPFLINQSMKRLSVQHKAPITSKSKRISVPPNFQHKQQQQIQLMSKIYNIKRQKSLRRKSYLVLHQQKSTESAHKLQITNDSAGLKGTPSKSVKFHRLDKVKSHTNHLPEAPDVSPRLHQKSNRKISRIQPVFQIKRKEESPILGVKFKKNKDLSHQYASEILDSPPEEHTHWQTFKGDIKKKAKYLRQRKQWQKMRGVNVDSIVNRNCKQFNNLITEYSRRMQIKEGSLIFVFDSKDLWMKRVLIDRGWVQNSNKTSKAFHLLWSNKLQKEQPFPEQRSNHYRKSYSLTTKTGLHNLLKKYDLAHLQPLTFDLSTEKDAFLSQYYKIQFTSNLHNFLKQFDFQDPEFNLSLQQVLSQIDRLIEGFKEQLSSSKPRQKLIFSIASHCKSTLQNTLNEYDCTLFDKLNETIRSSQLNDFQEEGIRVLRDFQIFASKEALVPNQKTIGHQNLWLTKSKISSKGVGITLHNELYSILKFTNRLVQKYIQKPLIFEGHPFFGRKFDLRIWVLVVGSRPQIYYHQQFYGRICFQGYSLNPEDLKNQSIHLTNFSQNKQRFTKSKELSQSIILPEDLFKAVQKYLGFQYKSKFHTDVERMLKKLAQIFKKEIAGKQTSNCFQLFGFDVILDSSLHMHLLEVNLSAACQERHQSLTQMLEEMGHGIINILECKHPEKQIQLNGWRHIE